MSFGIDIDQGAPVRRIWVAATLPELSCAPLRDGIPVDGPWPGLRSGTDIGIATGCGPTAGAALAWCLARFQPRDIVGLGIAGVYPGSPCKVGRVYSIRTDRFLDFGAESGCSDSVEALPFPGLSHDVFTLAHLPEFDHLEPADAATTALATGTAQTAMRRRASGADLESMEGSAWAQVARSMGVPFAQIRAVSNVAGPRDRGSWIIPAALEALRTALAPCGQGAP